MYEAFLAEFSFKKGEERHFADTCLSLAANCVDFSVEHGVLFDILIYVKPEDLTRAKACIVGK
jgi:hypothetical protein